MTLEVLICSLNKGIVRVQEVLLPPCENVRYIVSYQYTDERYLDLIPEKLTQRSDVQIFRYNGQGLSANRNLAIEKATADLIMFADDDYIRATRELISRERDRVIDVLSRIDTIKVYPTEANFVLYRILREDVDAQQLFEYCIRRHMMVRNCASFPFLDDRYVRFCFMEPEQNDALLDTMKEILL